MVCPTCGTSLEPGVRFCPKCGTQVFAAEPMQGGPAAYGPPPPQMPQQMPYIAPGMVPVMPRVQSHLQTLGILWCVYAAYRVLGGVTGMLALRFFAGRRWGGGGWPFGGSMMPFGAGWMGALLPVVITFTLFAMALALFTGWSLLNRKPWGRTLAIVAAILSLLKFPVGTALGIYTLWVLAPGASGLEYDAIADRT